MLTQIIPLCFVVSAIRARARYGFSFCAISGIRLSRTCRPRLDSIQETLCL